MLATSTTAAEKIRKALELQNEAMRLLAEVEPEAWKDQHRLQIAQERIWELEQLADPNNDSHPYSDRW